MEVEKLGFPAETGFLCEIPPGIPRREPGNEDKIIPRNPVSFLPVRKSYLPYNLDGELLENTTLSLKLYFLRHGQTARSRDNVFCGALDPELTPEGLEMAKAFATAYHSTPWAAIFSSPMKRTIATGQFLSDALGIKMELRDGLKEISYGKWEGQTVETVSRDYHDDYIRWSADPAWYPPTDGELAFAIASRALQVIEEIKQHHSTSNVLIVSHKATIRIILCSLLGIDVGRFRYRLGCPVGSISIVEFSSHGPLLHALADRTHLNERLRTLPGT